MEKESEKLLGEAQVYQQQLQTIMSQKSTLSMEANEIKKALEELGKTKEKHVFKMSGPLLIKSQTKDAKKDLKEREERIDLRLKSFEKQEKALKEKIEGLRERIMGKEPQAG